MHRDIAPSNQDALKAFDEAGGLAKRNNLHLVYDKSDQGMFLSIKKL